MGVKWVAVDIDVEEVEEVEENGKVVAEMEDMVDEDPGTVTINHHGHPRVIHLDVYKTESEAEYLQTMKKLMNKICTPGKVMSKAEKAEKLFQYRLIGNNKLS